MSIQVNEFRYVQGENDAEYIKLLKEALDEQKKVTGKAIAKIKELSRRDWIPCSERLPEEDGLYLVTDHKGEVVRYVFSNNESSRDYWIRCAVAWMPSPEPYREGE